MAKSMTCGDCPVGKRERTDIRKFVRLVLDGNAAACLKIMKDPMLAMQPVMMKGVKEKTLGGLVLRRPTPEVAIAALESPETAMIRDGDWTLGGLSALNSREAGEYVKEHSQDILDVEKCAIDFGYLPARFSMQDLPSHTLIMVAGMTEMQKKELASLGPEWIGPGIGRFLRWADNSPGSRP